jgi:hypothetical protein
MKSWFVNVSKSQRQSPIFLLNASLMSSKYSGKTVLSFDLKATVKKNVIINLNASN